MLETIFNVNLTAVSVKALFYLYLKHVKTASTADQSAEQNIKQKHRANHIFTTEAHSKLKEKEKNSFF